jgi:GT2 family glycosyltransferase
MSRIGIGFTVVNNWQKFTKPALDSIVTKHDKRIVIYDNASVDDTQVESMKLVNDNFHYKRSEENVGCTIAWNYILRDCFQNHNCDYVAILNNDVLFHPEAMDRLVERFERADEDVVMVTSINVKGDCKGIPSNIFVLNTKDYENLDEGEHPDFSSFMVNRNFIEKVGYFDEAYSMIGRAYFEDNCQHRRIKLAGMKAINCPTSLYYHYGSGSRSQTLTLPMNYRFESNRDYFMAKWGGMPDNDNPGRIDILFEHPFNDLEKDYKWTLQSVNQDERDAIIRKYKKI